MEKSLKLNAQFHEKSNNEHEKKHHQWREWIRDVYFVKGLSRKEISRHYHISINTVRRWTQSADQDCTIDKRGWPRGMKRAYPPETMDRIKAIHQTLSEDPLEFFSGASAIEHEWRMRYPEPPPPLRTIGVMMREMRLSALRKKGKSKGAASYLHYPEYTIYHGLGGRVIEADFIGKKFLTGRTAPLCFQGFSSKLPPKVRAFRRVEAETAEAFIEGCVWFLANYEKPMYMKVDNAAAMHGSISQERTISRVARYLLSEQIVPIYAVPRRPFTQASIEGGNSMFSRKFWTQRMFDDLSDVDLQLGWFNDAIRRYHGYVAPKKRRRSSSFQPRILYLRQVHESTQGAQQGVISVQSAVVKLPLAYVKYFVLAEWDLVDERLRVYFESDEKSLCIRTQAFKIRGEKLEC